MNALTSKYQPQDDNAENIEDVMSFDIRHQMPEMDEEGGLTFTDRDTSKHNEPRKAHIDYNAFDYVNARLKNINLATAHSKAVSNTDMGNTTDSTNQSLQEQKGMISTNSERFIVAANVLTSLEVDIKNIRRQFWNKFWPLFQGNSVCKTIPW